MRKILARTPRAPCDHEAVFAEFAMRLMGFLAAKRMARRAGPHPRFRLVR
ncbi:hypothetical protein [Afifella sp. IM 167]|nr:hypothetical protein [Afifella sp. IM 167]